PADRAAHVRVRVPVVRGVRSAVEPDHSEVRVPAAAIDTAAVEHRDVLPGVEDRRRRSVPRAPARQAGPDPGGLVRPPGELLALVPVLGRVERLVVVEARRRREHPGLALVRPLHAVLLEWGAAAEHAAWNAS